LAELYDRYAPQLYAYACLLARSPSEAEDIVQNCFVRMAGRLDRLAEVENLRSYLLTLCRNEAFRYRSRWQRWWRGDVACGTVRPGIAAGRNELGADEAARVRQALAELPPLQREVVFLKVWQELTFAEIGGILGTSTNTAASRYRYGIAKLRRRLSHER